MEGRRRICQIESQVSRQPTQLPMGQSLIQTLPDRPASSSKRTLDELAIKLRFEVRDQRHGPTSQPKDNRVHRGHGFEINTPQPFDYLDVPPWFDQKRCKGFLRVGAACETLAGFPLHDQMGFAWRTHRSNEPPDDGRRSTEWDVGEDLVVDFWKWRPQEIAVN